LVLLLSAEVALAFQSLKLAIIINLAVIFLVSVVSGLLALLVWGILAFVFDSPQFQGSRTVEVPLTSPYEGQPFGYLLDPRYNRQHFHQTGRLPMSRSISGECFRWQNPKHFWGGNDFWKTFEDGPWKWAAQQRYAGAKLNCGHYFSMSPEGATAEAKFYGMETSHLLLLKFTGQADAVLDLTYEDNLIEVSKLMFKNPEALDDASYLMMVLSFLVDPSQGGSNATDWMGYWASSRGYDGILFFGTRALEAYPELRHQIDHGRDWSMGMDNTPFHFWTMRSRIDLYNLVMLSGSSVIRDIRTVQLPGGTIPEHNQYFGIAEDELDRLFTYNKAFQDEQCRYNFPQLEIRPRWAPKTSQR
jgi:hypothetical protein